MTSLASNKKTPASKRNVETFAWGERFVVYRGATHRSGMHAPSQAIPLCTVNARDARSRYQSVCSKQCRSRVVLGEVHFIRTSLRRLQPEGASLWVRVGRITRSRHRIHSYIH